jgi:hypothetical protein
MIGTGRPTWAGDGYLAAHPEAMVAVLPHHGPRQLFAALTYNGLHAFGRGRPRRQIRWSCLVPGQAESLSDDGAHSPDLRDELAERLYLRPAIVSCGTARRSNDIRRPDGTVPADQRSSSSRLGVTGWRRTGARWTCSLFDPT